MDESKAVVTFETIFELLMREKTREELQKIDQSFYQDIVGYLSEKSPGPKGKAVDIFAASESDKLEKQLHNTKKLIKELYERREKKIIDMALNRSKAKSTIIDSTALLPHEKELFLAVVEILDSGRKNVLFRLLNAEDPIDIFSDPEITKIKPKTIKTDVDSQEKTKLLRFIKPVPRFVGLDLEEYGPFEEEDLASIPVQIAEVLIARERAEEIKQNENS